MKKRYDSYKPSGIDWIGDIPSHWTVCRIKDCFILKTGTTPKGFDKPINDNEINWFTPSDINSSGTILHEAERKLSENLINKEGISLFPQKSLIFVGIGATAGKLGYAKVAGYSNQQITGLIPKSCCSKYYFYYLCHDSKRVRDNASFTTLPIINNSYLSQVYWVMPPLAEQEAIAAWLDKKCDEIDAAIAKVDREIELIDELKRSEISHAVTHGLNPDAPLRPSGIDWIGDVPGHWGNTRLKFDCSLKGRIGWNGLKSDEFRDLSYAYLVTGQDFKGKNIEWSKCYQIDKWRYDEDPFIQLSNGDLLVTKDGTIGKVALVNNLDKPACLNSGIFVLKLTSKKFKQSYLYWTLVSSQLADFNYFKSGTSTTIQHLYQNIFENMPLVVPPLEEQQAIADYLDKKCAEIDGLRAKLTKKRETLTELRQSIISEVVTGKRKVI